MPTEILVALIAFAGVLASVAASLVTSMRLTNAELQKLRTEIQQTYADKLLEKRLDVYPSLYALLSDFVKKIQSNTMSKSVLEELRTQIEEWDSKHAVLFSGRAGIICYRFRKMLAELMQKPDEELQKDLASVDFLRELRYKTGELELALKGDLGIYVVEFSDLTREFKSYQEVAEAIGRKPTRQL